LVPLVLLTMQGMAHAAEVVITPNVSASPAADYGGWTFKMAIASISLIVVVALLLITAYLRFAPRFYLGQGSGDAPPVGPQARAGAAGGGGAPRRAPAPPPPRGARARPGGGAPARRGSAPGLRRSSRGTCRRGGRACRACRRSRSGRARRPSRGARPQAGGTA